MGVVKEGIYFSSRFSVCPFLLNKAQRTGTGDTADLGHHPIIKCQHTSGRQEDMIAWIFAAINPLSLTRFLSFYLCHSLQVLKPNLFLSMIHFFFPSLLRASNLSINKTWASTPEIPVSFFKSLHRTQIVGIELVVFSSETITLY